MGIIVMQAFLCVPRRTAEVEHGGLILRMFTEIILLKFQSVFEKS